MIADALTRMPFRTPDEALAMSLAKARERLPINEPAERMNGKRGTVRAIIADGMQVMVLIELPDGTRIREPAGFWHGRSSL